MAKIQLIDDDRTLLRALQVRLIAAGYETEVASNGADGLVNAEQGRPHLILLDVRMRGMDGYEVCRRLKTHPLTESIPVVIMSANTAKATRRQALEAGAVEFLPKPLDIKRVLRVLDSVLTDRSGPGNRKDTA